MTKDDKSFRDRWKFPSPSYYVDQRVTSHNQTAGITAHTVNILPPSRQLDDNFKAQFLKMVPRDRLVEVEAAANDPEAASFAQEAWNFLVASGYEMSPNGIGYVMSAPPMMGQKIDLESDRKKAVIRIGHQERR